jgi:acyl transferase domain-containing protein
MSDMLRQLARMIRELPTERRALLSELLRPEPEPIALVGMGCRLPAGVESPDALWEVLAGGMDVISEVPADRWELHAFHDPDPEAKGKGNTRWGGFLHGVDGFDPSFFGITPREAIQMDPQQRLLLEVAYESFEDAGIPLERLAGSQTGVFVGISGGDYNLLQLAHPEQTDAYTFIGGVRSIIANRLSYLFDFRGPSLVIDTACSSSLVAVHQACQSLRVKECDVALAGGLNLVLSPHWSVALSKLQALAMDGRCKPFDAHADGFVRAEGCGTVVLKRLSDALAAGDRIRALIRGSATNQDGHSQGLTAPNGITQQALLRQALRNAGVKPEQVGFIEAHGTGTRLGDPIEVGALSEVYGKPHPGGQPCLLGSVKANVGHLEAAAGVAGLLKLVLVLERGIIPKQPHFQELNPNISLEGTRFSIPTESQPWPSSPGARRLGAVSSFGIGGTNAHMVLEEAPKPAPRPVSAFERPRHLLALSARSDEALRALAGRFERHLSAAGEEGVGDVCHTAHLGRTHFNHRMVVEGGSAAELRERLARFAAGEASSALVGTVEGETPREVAFLFTGQGSQYVDMGGVLYRTQPVFREVMDRCDALLAVRSVPLLSVLYPEPGVATPIDETALAQPALFALQCALAELWRSWGIQPSVVMGHSVGEFAAAYVAGVLTLEDGLRLTAERGRLMQALPAGGAMAALFTSEAQVAEALRPLGTGVSIAAINGTSEVVVSGRSLEVDALIEHFRAQGVEARRLIVSHAFHSSLMEPVLTAFSQLAEEVPCETPRVKFISTLTGQLLTEAPSAAYWSRHLREPVRFLDGLRTLGTLGCGTIIEVGPTATLIGMGRRALADEGIDWLPSLRKGKEDWQQLLSSLGALYVRGFAIDWAGFDQGYSRRRTSIPTYPFQHKRYWLAESSSERPVARVASTAHPVAPEAREQLYRLEWRPKASSEPEARSVTERDGATWLLLEDRSGVGQALAERLSERGARCLRVVAGEGTVRQSDGVWTVDPSRVEDLTRLLEEGACDERYPLRGVVHLWSLDLPNEPTGVSSLAALRLGCGGALTLVQALAAFSTRASPPRVWWVTRGVHGLGASEANVAVTQAPLWGFGRVAALEHPESWGGLVDLPPVCGEAEIDSLLRELASPAQADQIALRHSTRSVLHLAPLTLPAPGNAFHPRADGAYLITGGLGGIGLRVAQWLVERGARYLVLVSRRGLADAQRSAVEAMERAGVRVLVAQGDVSHRDALAEILERVRRELPPLRGIIHSAGVLDDGLLLRQDWQRFERVMAPKVEGAWNLHTLTRDCELDFFALFSSMVAALGARGQGNYAAANASLDALVHLRHAEGLPAVSIQWGPWAEVGMAVSHGPRGLSTWTKQGMTPLVPEEGLRLLERLLGGGGTSGLAEVCVLPVDWTAFFAHHAGQRLPCGLAEIARHVRGGKEPVRAESPRLLERLEAAPASERRSLLTALLAEELARIMGMDSAHGINPREGFFAMGMDSLMAVELRERLQRETGRALSSSCVFNYPTLESLTGYLANSVLQLEAAGNPADSSSPPVVRPGPAEEATQARVDLEELSGAALASLFDEQLSAIDSLMEKI